MDVILKETGDLRVVFPLHPRTKKNLNKKYLNSPKLIVVEPMGYLEFIFLVKNSKAVITDSGGITEEATVLNIPCITLRNSTERPETVTLGSNELAGTNPNNLIPYLKKIKNNDWKKSSIPPLWDGKTSPRIVKKLISLYQN
jgi:UDP-N-acetylglucosamine 2-epimerase (non-hydrolysing)